MVAPIYIIAIALAAGFSLGIFGKFSKKTAYFVTVISLAVMTAISMQWLSSFLSGDIIDTKTFSTATGVAPYVIVLKMGLHEAVITVLINIAGLFGAIYMSDKLIENGYASMATFIVAIMGMNGMVLTGDLFNLFVFMEISGIAITGLILFNKNVNALSAGFKYMTATGIISGLLLIGIIFTYYYTGTLNIAELSTSNALKINGGLIALFLVIVPIILELKPFPANGWGLDIYEASHPGLSGIISAASATASWFVLSKVLPLGGESWYEYALYIGLITFLGSNLIGLKQKGARRLLGYSSIGQIGLLTAVLGMKNSLGSSFEFIAFGLLISNYLAKAGLFWITGIIKEDRIHKWGIIKRNPIILFIMGTFIFLLLGFPPFPSFFAKWTLVMKLADNGSWFFIAALLTGSLLEAVYLLRWFGYAVKIETDPSEKFNFHFSKLSPIIIFAVGAYILGYFTGVKADLDQAVLWLPLAAAATLFIIDKLPVYIKNTLVIGLLSWYGWTVIPGYTDFKLIFSIIFIAGGAVLFIPGYLFKGSRKGFYPIALIMYGGLAGILEADNMFSFFFAWEIMTLGSYLLILRGEKAMKPALSYILFSLGGAYFLLLGSAFLYSTTGSVSLSAFSNVNEYSYLTYIFMALGFMTKLASIGFHIWLPDAYAEAEDDVSPMLSGVLIKAGVFGLIIFMLPMGDISFKSINLPYILGWIGAITALIGNLLAIFQEDIKKLIAYSSIGQMGYVLFAFALMSHLGWLTATAFAVNHFIFKSLLFLAAAGVIYRLKTRNMYEMGGLIKKMPISFISVMIGIIALSGVPPLSGFAGKWLSYNAVIFKGWYFQGFVISIAGLIAFLYCFRLVYTVFLGQPKTEHKYVKEAPIWYLIPQFILLGTVMVFSLGPNLILKPIGEFLLPYFPENPLIWEGSHASTSLGYWNPVEIMYIVGAIFVTLAIWLFVITRKAKKVKQFNIVFAAERPFTPETTHFAYNFFAPYKKALGFLVMPVVTGFWNIVSDILHGAAEFFRKIYSGNGQTYAAHILLFVVVFYFITLGG